MKVFVTRRYASGYGETLLTQCEKVKGLGGRPLTAAATPYQVRIALNTKTGWLHQSD